MSEEQKGYGYAETEVRETPYTFGLNADVAHLVKFEWTPNGGKDGAEQEALDIIFNVNGKEVSYRKFPVTRAYFKEEGATEQTEVTDPKHPAIQAEKNVLGAVLAHIVGCFVEKEDIKTALQTPIKSFKDYCKILQGLLPKDVADKSLDIFFHWGWQIKGEGTRTYLELPKNMKQGRWLAASVTPTEGDWEKQHKKNAADNERSLRYVDKSGQVHPFTRTGWYMNSNYANQQRDTEAPNANISEGSETSNDGGW